MYVKALLYGKSLILVALISGVLACGSSAPQVTTTVTAGQDTLVNLQNIVFYAPAGNLPEGMEISLTAEAADDLAEDVLGPNDEALSELLTVSFGQLPASRALYTIQFQLEPTLYSNIAVLTRTVGGLTTDGVIDTGWTSGLGQYDEKKSVYSVTFAATAQQVSLLVYTRRTDDLESGHLQRFPEQVRKGLEIIGSIAGISSVSAQENVPAPPIEFANVDLTSHGWAIRCDPRRFARGGICSTDSSRLKKMAQLAVKSAEILKNIGFSKAYLRTKTRASLEIIPDVVVFADSADPLASDQSYFIMVLEPRLEKGDAYYEYNAAKIHLLPKAESIIIHEIMHAVQSAEIGELRHHEWVGEGTAAAVEPFAPEYSGNRGKAFRYHDKWRDWSVGLNKPVEGKKKVWPYEVSEYWLSIDPGLSVLPKLFNAIGPSPSVVSGSGSFDLIDQGLKATTGTGLDDSYTQLIETRNGEIKKGYRLCKKINFTCKDKECPIPEKRSFQFEPVSANCFKVKAKFPDLDCDAPRYKLDLEGDDQKHRFIVDGQRFEADESATVEKEFILWVLNLARDEQGHTKPEATLRGVCKGPVSIVSQEHGIAATVSSCEPSSSGYGACQRKIRGLKYSSDLLEGSSRVNTWENDREFGPDNRDVRDGHSPIQAGQEFARSFDVEVDGGSRAVAYLSTLTREEDNEFIVEGQFKLQATHADLSGWGGTANSEVDFSIWLVVGAPATMHITNCELFEVGGTFLPVNSSGRNCEYKSSLDSEMMDILQNTNYAPPPSKVNTEQKSFSKAFPKGESLMLTFRQQAFSSSERVTGDSAGQFKVRIAFD